MFRTLSATMGPLVALVSAAMTTPPSYRQPTMVVPVDVALGSGTPLAWRAMFRLWLLKSKPGIVAAKQLNISYRPMCMWEWQGGDVNRMLKRC